jgi:hypothetical protein
MADSSYTMGAISDFLLQHGEALPDKEKDIESSSEEEVDEEFELRLQLALRAQVTDREGRPVDWVGQYAKDSDEEEDEEDEEDEDGEEDDEDDDGAEDDEDDDGDGDKGQRKPRSADAPANRKAPAAAKSGRHQSDSSDGDDDGDGSDSDSSDGGVDGGRGHASEAKPAAKKARQPQVAPAKHVAATSSVCVSRRAAIGCLVAASAPRPRVVFPVCRCVDTDTLVLGWSSLAC